MTTLDPGASVVFTHGLVASPRSTAFLASSAAPIITCGLEVLVQEVMAAITTWPWSISVSVPSSMVTLVGFDARFPPPLPETAACGWPAWPLPCANGLAGSEAGEGGGAAWAVAGAEGLAGSEGGKPPPPASSALDPSSAASSGSLSPSG